MPAVADRRLPSAVPPAGRLRVECGSIAATDNASMSSSLLLWPALGLTFNAFVWGVSWWPFRQLEGLGLHPLWATAFIYIVASCGIALARPDAFRTMVRTPALWVLVAAAGTTNASFNWAVTIGDVVRVILLFYMMPLWTVLLARLLLKERLTAGAGLRVGLALGGAALVLWPQDGGLPLPRTAAEGLAIVGSFSFALNNVMLRRESHHTGASRALSMFVGGALVAGLLAVGLWVAGPVPAPPAPRWDWMLGGALLGAVFVASNLTLQYGAARLPANTMSVIMLTEVFFAAGSALLLGAAALTTPVAVGGALIIAAAVSAATSGDEARTAVPAAGA